MEGFDHGKELKTIGKGRVNKNKNFNLSVLSIGNSPIIFGIGNAYDNLDQAILTKKFIMVISAK